MGFFDWLYGNPTPVTGPNGGTILDSGDQDYSSGTPTVAPPVTGNMLPGIAGDIYGVEKDAGSVATTIFDGVTNPGAVTNWTALIKSLAIFGVVIGALYLIVRKL